MSDPTEPSPGNPPTTPPQPAAKSGNPDDRLGRYDANLQLIRRRLADHKRTTSTKAWWWWPGR
jgi:hypothetical protein